MRSMCISEVGNEPLRGRAGLWKPGGTRLRTEALDDFRDRFSEGVQVVAAFQEQDEPAATALLGDFAKPRRKLTKGLAGNPHRRERVLSMGVEAGGYQHDLGSELE